MNFYKKIQVLGGSAKYDLCGSYLCTSPPRKRDPLGRWIYPAVLPEGKTILLLKILLSNACENDCKYCFNRCSRDFHRMGYQPDDLAKLFINLFSHRKVQGLFLSSAVCTSVASTMEKMIKTVEILRFKYRFKGYIHLKILPGAGFDYIKRAVQLSDRVSVNLEAPSRDRLKSIASDKNLDKDILLPLKWIKVLRSEKTGAPAGHTTQFVVGASGESDKEILKTTSMLYSEFDLTRAYFSSFQPVPGTPLENHPPTPLLREHRLYQSDFLLRKYNFKFEEIIFDSSKNLPLSRDPKQIWSLTHPERFPVEVNTATKQQLLRVPGIGPKSAERIVRMRGRNNFYTLEELRGVGVVVKWVRPFILINGKKQSGGFQCRLFP